MTRAEYMSYIKNQKTAPTLDGPGVIPDDQGEDAPTASATAPAASTAPADPYQWMATTKPNYGKTAADPAVQKLIADFIKDNGLTASQSDPSSLRKIAEFLHSKGINAQVDMVDENGHTGGLQVNGQSYQLIDGSNNWTPLQPWEDGGGAMNDDDWFQSNLPAPEAFQEPGRPDYLQGAYTPPTWNEQFNAPSMTDLQNDPGYQSRLAASQKGFERSAAARGSILSGGSQVALGRTLQDFASNEYGNVFGRAYDTYKQKYGQFQDKLAADFGARGLNESSYQNDVSNARERYQSRYRTWRDSVDDQFRLGQLGFGATTAGAPS